MQVLHSFVYMDINIYGKKKFKAEDTNKPYAISMYIILFLFKFTAKSMIKNSKYTLNYAYRIHNFAALRMCN